MLVTKQPILSRFWYPVIPIKNLADGPKSFELLGRPLVLWLDQEGKPGAAEDRCCHRSARLSLGKVTEGNLSCPYHGWQFNRHGECVKIPQLKDNAISANSQLNVYNCDERYGYVWVCLADEPLTGIPNIEETSDPNYRTISEFYETWQCAGLRVMENECDLAHPAFVHQGTFGTEEHLIPGEMEFTETEWELRLQSVLGVVNPELQRQNLKMEAKETIRTLDIIWFMPFMVKLRIGYPNGLVHIVVNTMTPISDSTSQMVQFCVRNDTEADTPAADVIAFDRAVTLEDKRILESTDFDVPLSPNREQHIFTDKPGLIMRKKILALLKAHGEVEQTRETEFPINERVRLENWRVS
jgi:phenylpropionate dioxygenase-like ring-hydroxylating dioxygenase large terminal subunit